MSLRVETSKCHWCTEEHSKMYATVVQLFQRVDVCCLHCLNKYADHANTAIIEIKLHHVKHLKRY